MIPVVWAHYDAKLPCRGYWDQAFNEAVFARELWRPANGHQFGPHFEVRGGAAPDLLHGGPAIFMVPARAQTAPEAYDWLNGLLSRFDAAIVFLTGDEESDFDHHALQHPRLAIWVMAPDSTKHADIPPHRRFGTMFPPFTRLALAKRQGFSAAMVRPKDVYLSAQNTHARRQQCFEALANVPNSHLRATKGFTEGVEPETYTRFLACAKIAPCPSGPVTPDTFRLWEALEAGCIPIADGATPKGPQPGFWPFLLGEDTPFPVVVDWSVLPILVSHLLAQWPTNSNRIFAWWQGYRRELIYRLHDDIVDVLGVAPSVPLTAEDAITALVSTSPIPSHPSLDIIAETIESIRERLGDCEIIIGIDGVRPEQEDRRADYEEYVRRLLWKCAHVWHNVVPVRLDAWGHQANVTREMLKLVRTDVILFVEHDTPLANDTPFAKLASIVLDGDTANVIRLSHEASILPPHRHLFLDDNPVPVHSLPLTRTVQWSQRPHLARTDFYRDIIDRYFAPESRAMIEDVMYGPVFLAWHEHGIRGWRDWRLWMYTPDGDIRRSANLDGRADESKYTMTFSYPNGVAPEFAPIPQSDEEPADGPR